jgi:hypothetical protein
LKHDAELAARKALRFVASANEQSAPKSNGSFHGSSFHLGSELKMVVPRGNAPRSLAYRARALLLSYRTWRKASVTLRPRFEADPVFETGAASLYLPAFQKWLAEP